MERPGKCRWCGCTFLEPCPEGCGWANVKQTLCTACVNVDREWRKLKTRRPNMRRAFFRGYMVGSWDERAEHGLTGAALLRRIAAAAPPTEADYEVVWSGGEGLTSYPEANRP